MKNFLMQNWANILSSASSVCAIIVSICANCRVKAIHRQDKQEPLCSDIKRLLDYKCDYHSAEQKIIDCYKEVPCVSKEEEKEIKQKVHRYFGKKEYKELCEILNLCSEARNIDSDMFTLFDLIKSGEQQKFDKLRETLLKQDCEISEQEKKEEYIFLKTISVSNYKITENCTEKSYDYLELSENLEKLNKDIQNKRENFERDLDKVLVKK